MSWSNNENNSGSHIYKTTSINQTEIVNDLTVVINRVIKSKVKDKAENVAGILLYTNATNGYLKVNMYDIEKMTEVGNSLYILELPLLWELSNEHKDGSLFFEQIIEESINLFCKTETGIEIKKKFKIFFSEDADTYEV